MLDDTISVCRLLYFSKHFDIAFFETMGELTLPIVPLKPDLEYGQNLCVLARDNKTDLICTTVRVKYVDPYEYQHNHYLFIDGSIPKVMIYLYSEYLGVLIYNLNPILFAVWYWRCIGRF